MSFCVLCPRGLLVVLYVQTRCLCCARTRHPYKRVGIMCQVSRGTYYLVAKFQGLLTGGFCGGVATLRPCPPSLCSAYVGGLRSMSFAGDLGIKQLRETQQKKKSTPLRGAGSPCEILAQNSTRGAMFQLYLPLETIDPRRVGKKNPRHLRNSTDSSTCNVREFRAKNIIQ